MLEREWHAQYWSRSTTLTEEEYYADEENWARALAHGWNVINEERGIKKVVEEDDEDDDDEEEEDDDDEYEYEDEAIEEGEEEEAEADAAGGADVVSKEGAAKTKKKAAKTEADVAQVTIPLVGLDISFRHPSPCCRI